MLMLKIPLNVSLSIRYWYNRDRNWNRVILHGGWDETMTFRTNGPRDRDYITSCVCGLDAVEAIMPVALISISLLCVTVRAHANAMGGTKRRRWNMTAALHWGPWHTPHPIPSDSLSEVAWQETREVLTVQESQTWDTAAVTAESVCLSQRYGAKGVIIDHIQLTRCGESTLDTSSRACDTLHQRVAAPSAQS